MQPWTGINTIMTQIGRELQHRSFSFGYYVPIIISFVLFGSIFGAIYTSNSFGKRTILLAGGLGLAVCDIMIGTCFYFYDKFNGIPWIILVLLSFFMVIYGTTIGPAVWMYIPEIIPGKVVPVAATLNFFSSTCCLSLSPVIAENQGSAGVYFCFGVITLAITLINIFGLVESKGKNSEEIRISYLGDSVR